MKPYLINQKFGIQPTLINLNPNEYSQEFHCYSFAIKLEKTFITYGNIKIEKQKFQQHKRPISTKNPDINKIVVFNKVSFGKKGFKYLICCKNTKIRSLYIFLPTVSPYRRHFDQIKYTYSW